MPANDDDDLLRQARELGRDAELSRQAAAGAGRSASERFAEDNRYMRGLTRFADKTRHRLGPIGTFLAFILRWFSKWVRWLCLRPADAVAAGSPSRSRFSILRLVRNLAITVLVLLAVHLIWCAAYYYGTSFEETVYVTGKQEIVTGELYQFGGCTALPCSTAADNGKFYLIEASLYFPVLLYPEEEVFANVPQQDAACNVRGYGIYFRSLRWIYKTFQLYQHVVDVSCRPYTEEEIKRAVTEGEIVHDE